MLLTDPNLDPLLDEVEEAMNEAAERGYGADDLLVATVYVLGRHGLSMDQIPNVAERYYAREAGRSESLTNAAIIREHPGELTREEPK